MTSSGGGSDNLASHISPKKPLVLINANQKFGYHKDTPFVIEDSSKGNQLAMHFNNNTKSLFEKETQRVPGSNRHFRTARQGGLFPQKLFT